MHFKGDAELLAKEHFGEALSLMQSVQGEVNSTLTFKISNMIQNYTSRSIHLYANHDVFMRIPCHI
jgi:hypothetical protein